MTQPGEESDPTRHLLSRRRHERRPDGTDVSYPIPLAEGAELRRAVVENGRKTEARLEFPVGGTSTVAFSRGRATVAADLLEELALRLRPGFAVGPVTDGAALADLAEEIASYLHRRT